jgi:hypothetical protein
MKRKWERRRREIQVEIDVKMEKNWKGNEARYFEYRQLNIACNLSGYRVT